MQHGMGFAASSIVAASGASGPVAPIIAGAMTAVTGLVKLFKGRRRPKQKEAATKIVDDAEPLLQQNLQAWQSSGQTATEQSNALANFDAVWAKVKEFCDRSELGPPGQWCINDRKRGGQWDWFRRYRDPIAQAEVRAPQVMQAGVLPTELLQQVGGEQGLAAIAVVGIVLLGAFFMMGD